MDFTISDPYLRVTVIFISAHNLTGLIGHGLLYIIEKVKLLQRYRINPKHGPPSELTQKAFYRYLLDSFILLPVLSYTIVAPLVFWRGMNERFPSVTNFILQTVFGLIVADFLFYWFHRGLHQKWFYNTIHKQHHEFTITSSIASEYSHVLETITNVITVMAGPLILGSNPYIYASVASFRLWESFDCHSGYSFPWYMSPWALLRSTKQHYFHHSRNIGAYGMFAFWDEMCGTNAAYYNWLEKGAPEEKK